MNQCGAEMKLYLVKKRPETVIPVDSQIRTDILKLIYIMPECHLKTTDKQILIKNDLSQRQLHSTTHM